MGIFLCIGLNVCIVRSIESSHGDGYFESSLLAIFVDNYGKVSTEIDFFFSRTLV